MSSNHNNKNVTCIIQARTDSERLPNKVLEKIENKPMIWHIINRVKHAKTIKKIVLAIPDTNSNRALLEIAKQTGIIGFAGNELDVLDRYYNAAIKNSADPIVRITGDCPLIDPSLIDEIVNFYLSHDYDYVSNTLTRSYPDGLDTEIFSFSSLKNAYENAIWESEREHVTPYIFKNTSKFRTYSFENSIDNSKNRWVVDKKLDLKFVRKLYEKFRPGI